MMNLTKILSFTKRYRHRCINFYSSTIAGLFTGVAIGMLFSLISYSPINRWINLFSFELFAAIIYFVGTYLVLAVFYTFGRLFLRLIVSKKKEDLIAFKINYFAGLYSALWSTSLIIFHTHLLTAIVLCVIFIIFYFPIEYFVVRTKKYNKINKQN